MGVGRWKKEESGGGMKAPVAVKWRFAGDYDCRARVLPNKKRQKDSRTPKPGGDTENWGYAIPIWSVLGDFLFAHTDGRGSRIVFSAARKVGMSW
jgi:hypothetical protein